MNTGDLLTPKNIPQKTIFQDWQTMETLKELPYHVHVRPDSVLIGTVTRDIHSVGFNTETGTIIFWLKPYKPY